MSPRIEIHYCTGCRWLLRAAWMAQELLTTFEQEIGEVALVPGSGGVFEVRVDGAVVWSRAEQGRFPEIKELKQLVRDRIAPEKGLGHSDRAATDSSPPYPTEMPEQVMQEATRRRADMNDPDVGLSHDEVWRRIEQRDR